MLYPDAFAVKSHLGEEMHGNPWEDPECTKYELRTRQIKMTSQKKLEEMPHKGNSNDHEGATQALSL